MPFRVRTTCAVAHKMNRKWIGLENGNQLDEICVPRLKAIVDGTDEGGITKKWVGRVVADLFIMKCNHRGLF